MCQPARPFAPKLLNLRLAVWAASSAAWAAAVAWLAVNMQLAEAAPLGVFSVGVGVALGVGLAAVAYGVRAGHRIALVSGTLLLALLTTTGEHLLLYRAYRIGWSNRIASDPRVAVFQPEAVHSLPAYLKQESSDGRWGLWILDAALTAVAAVIVVCVALPKLCGRCQQWYRLVREETLPPERASSACHRANISRAADGPAQLRMWNCPQGCGAALLHLSWREEGRRRSATVWVDGQSADEIVRLCAANGDHHTAV